MIRRILGALCVALCAVSTGAFAQEWPTRPVRIVVPFAPGGATDVMARVMAKGIAENTGQTVIVENRPGAGGNVGSAFVAKSPADGYTLLVSAPGNFVINQFLYKAMPYSPEKDLVGVTVLGQAPIILIVSAKVQATNVRQLIEFAKANPGVLNGSSGGNGTSGHLSLELFKSMAGVNIVHVPFGGTAPSRMELLAGRIDLTMDNLANFNADLKAGSLRVLATGTENPSRFLPGVPTLSQSGLPGYSSTGWYALAAPAGVPRAVLEAINRQAVKALRSPAALQVLEGQGAETVAGTLEETERFFAAESLKWKKVVDASGAKIE